MYSVQCTVHAVLYGTDTNLWIMVSELLWALFFSRRFIMKDFDFINSTEFPNINQWKNLYLIDRKRTRIFEIHENQCPAPFPLISAYFAYTYMTKKCLKHFRNVSRVVHVVPLRLRTVISSREPPIKNVVNLRKYVPPSPHFIVSQNVYIAIIS